ncbi:HEAT repeat domain-containing protein [Photobacterium sp. DNB22_13_2]
MKTWLLLQTIAFESSGLYIITTQTMTPSMWLAFASTHAISCLSYSALCWLILPRQYKTPVISSFSFLFIFNYLLPVVGMIGTSCSLLIALYLPREKSNVTWQECEKSELPQSPGEVIDTQFGSGALREILLHNQDPERRLLAVSAVRNLPRQHAVPLLQLALKDLTDDVRLLAYASLESIETHINESLSLSKKQFEYKPSASKAFDIAQQYWELCYLGIAEGILRNHYLEQAENYLNQSNSIKTSASANLLLGRVLLELKRPIEAAPVLKAAMDGGLLLKQVAPYLAEASYISGDFQTAREYISYFPEQKGNKLSQIKEYWG